METDKVSSHKPKIEPWIMSVSRWLYDRIPHGNGDGLDVISIALEIHAAYAFENHDDWHDAGSKEKADD